MYIQKKEKKIHPATKSFQAFRIHINDELDELKQSLTQASNIPCKRRYYRCNFFSFLGRQ